jgi:protein TonB
MLLNIAITGQGVAMSILGILTLTVGIIILMRVFISSKSNSALKNTTKDKSKTSPLENRHKYEEVDTFKWSSTFLNLGLVLAVCITILAFSWTTYEDVVLVPENTFTFEEDIDMVPPTTMHSPPPPPPPPPPVFEPVAPEEIIENQPDFLDNTIEETTEVIAPKQKKGVPPTPPPPPPPPPVEKITELFRVVEQMPRFPGCEDEADKTTKKQCSDKKLLEYIYKNIKYPVIARETTISGTVVVRFVVETDGSITNTEIIRDPGGGLGKEALRVVEKMNKDELKWIPGQQRGKNVRVQFNLPVRFHLE